MQFNNIREMWRVDASIDKDKLEVESLTIDNLHAKYAEILYEISLELAQAKSKLDKLEVVKYNFYAGISTDEFPVVSSVKILKSQVDNYASSDPEIIALKVYIGEIDARYKYVDSIIWAISRRNHSIQNYINVIKISGGL
jgi:hypothetical protein